jgi:hypothetical protein
MRGISAPLNDEERFTMHAALTSRKAKVAGFLGTVAVTGGLLASAVVGTGAYFQDTKANNHITGTMGSIQIQGHDGSGANSLDAVFTNMLPGETQSTTLRYSNTGVNDQDVWLVFKGTDLGTGDGKTGINSLGTYGEVHVASNGGEKFASQNLNDNNTTCPAGTGSPACMPLPSKIKLADALEPGHTGDFSFSFKPSQKFKSVQLAQLLNLGYDLVATQVGVQPGA